MATLRSLHATFMRGGTSKAVVFRAEDLPADRAAWDAIFLAVMGSPDKYRRQLDGMGGGISSLSKICVVARSTRPDADVDYTFAQVSVDEPLVDYSGNCGNMSAAIGPFAVEEGLVKASQDGEAAVRIHNTNTGKLIVSRFRMREGKVEIVGDMRLDGVPGTGAPIRLDFVEPGGSKTGRLLPTGRPQDRLDIEGFGAIEVSLIDAANPCAFVRASDLGCEGPEMPEALEGNEQVMRWLESVRRSASVKMGFAATVQEAGSIPSVPKVAMIAPPQEYVTLSKERVGRRP
jgi:2-methylaconitate cis-trans-isomerase PrpF